MRDGRYDLAFSADGYSARGHLDLDGPRAVGGDAGYRLEGNVQDGRQHITATFNVTLDPGTVHNARVPPQFAVQMTGTTTDRGFSLIGIGPLGLIVELSCSHTGAPAAPRDR